MPVGGSLVTLGYDEHGKVIQQEVSMGNFERGVDKLFKPNTVAGKKYKKSVKQAGQKLSTAKKLRNAASPK
jgi:hypothetical protein